MTPLTTISVAAPSPESKRGFWSRRLRDPLLGFLAQGVTPTALSRAIALGAACGLFPFLGATTLLTLGAGWLLRLNQPVMQMVNYLLSPVQWVMIPIFVQAGAVLLGADAHRFSPAAMQAAAREGSVMGFLQQFSLAGWYALVAWLIAAPVIIATVFLCVSPIINRLAPKRPGHGGEA